jgi:hypothetical protein
VEVVGNTGAANPWHTGLIGAKVGTIDGAVTVKLIVVFIAHCPIAGVKVYVDVPTVAVLTTAGLQVPVIPFNEVVGNTGAGKP